MKRRTGASFGAGLTTYVSVCVHGHTGTGTPASAGPGYAYLVCAQRCESLRVASALIVHMASARQLANR